LRRILLAASVFLILLFLAASENSASAQSAGIELFQCYSESLNLTEWYSEIGPLRANQMVFYTYNFTSPGALNLTLSLQIASTQPIEVFAMDAKSGEYFYRSAPSTVFDLNETFNINSPAIVEIGIYNPGQAPADYRGSIAVYMCGSPAVERWISANIKIGASPLGNAAPVGIADYGALLMSGQGSFYRIETSSVRGDINLSRDAFAISYFENGTYAFPGFSVQLNAFLLLKLADGNEQLYWLQDALDWRNDYGGKLGYLDNVWNSTSSLSTFSAAGISGNGGVYFSGRTAGEQYYAYGKQSALPVGYHELIIAVGKYGRGAKVVFYVDGTPYDTVILSPYAQVIDAEIVVDPSKKSGYGVPLDVELVLGGYSGDEPIAVFSSGSIQLSLAYNLSGKWASPLSAWSLGAATRERVVASSQSSGIGASRISPGNPSAYELWSGLVLVITPYGSFLQSSGDISQYLRTVDLGNGTRLTDPVAYVNGQKLQGSSAEPGSVVVIEYSVEYRVDISYPLGELVLWVPRLSPLSSLVNETIEFPNQTRLLLEIAYANGEEVNLTSYKVEGPMNLTLVYSREYLISIYSEAVRENVWVREGENPASVLPKFEDLGNGTALVLDSAYFNGSPVDPYSFRIASPGNLSAIYSRAYLIKLLLPGNVTELWVKAGEAFSPPVEEEIYFENRTRLVIAGAIDSSGRNITFPLIVNGPEELLLEYRREYLVSLMLYGENRTGWIPEGSTLNLSQRVLLKQGEGTALSYEIYLVLRYIEADGKMVPPSEELRGPLVGRGIYEAVAYASASFLKMPNLFTYASLTCGSQVNWSASVLSSEMTLSLLSPSSYQCSLDAPIYIPLPVGIAVFSALLAVFLVRIRMKR